MKRIHSYGWIAALGVACAASFVSCGEVKRGGYVDGVGTIYCDDGFKNVLEEEIQVFEYTYPNTSILPTYVSEAEAVDALMGDSTQAIIVTHELNKSQINKIKKDYKRVVKQRCIAVDAVALIVNKDNPLDEISMEEIGKLMNGEITRWSEICPGDTTNIQLVFDNENSSTVMYMREKFLDNRLITDNPNVKVFAQKKNSEVFDVVKNNPDAIGIISAAWLGDSLEYARMVPIDSRIEDYESETPIEQILTTEVKVLGVMNPTELNDYSLTAYKPYQAYIATGEYPLFRKVYMVTTASSSTVMKSFYDFMTGYIGQKIISKTGILPYQLNPRVVEVK